MSAHRLPSSFPGAVHLTTATIRRRGALYRNTVVAISSVLLLPVLAGLFAWSWRPLVGVVVVVPVTAAFLWLDARLVQQWQEGVMAAWVDGAIRLDDLRMTVTGVKHLPPATLNGMFARLRPALNATGDVEARPPRLALAERLIRKARRDTRAAAASAAVLTFAAACACVAVVQEEAGLGVAAAGALAATSFARMWTHQSAAA